MRLIAREMLSGSLRLDRACSPTAAWRRNFALLVDALRRGQSRGTVRATSIPGLAVFLLLARQLVPVPERGAAQRNPDLAVITSTEAYAAELARLLALGLAPPARPARIRHDSPVDTSRRRPLLVLPCSSAGCGGKRRGSRRPARAQDAGDRGTGDARAGGRDRDARSVGWSRPPLRRSPPRRPGGWCACWWTAAAW